MSLVKLFKQIPPDILRGLIGIIIVFAGVTGLYSITFPWAGNDDQMPHVDYIWQVSQGQLPSFNEGTQYPEIGRYPYQYVSNHPPLYYMIQAPLMKVPLENGDWQFAVAIGRAMNIIIGIICILAFAWAGWVFSNRNHLFTLALPAVAAFYITFMQVIGIIMNDSLTVLFTTLALTTSYLILKAGPSRKYLYWLTVISVFGVASRSIYFVALFISLVAVIIAYSNVLKGKSLVNFKRTLKGIFISIVIFILAIIPSSWFYLRNYEQSGSFYKSSHGPNSITAKRKYKPLQEVLTSVDLYKAATINPLGRMYKGSASLIFTILAFTSVIYWVVSKNRWQKLFKNKPLITMVGLFVAYTVFILGGQVIHAWGYGQYSARYFLPSLLPAALIVTLGLYALRRYLYILLIGFILAASTEAMWQIADRLATRQPEIYGNMNWLEVLGSSITHNSVRPLLAYTCVAIIITGLVYFSWAYWLVVSGKKGR